MWQGSEKKIHIFQKVLKVMNKVVIFDVTKTTKHEKDPNDRRCVNAVSANG